MSEHKSAMKSLADFAGEVLDVNNDGVVNIKDFLAFVPANAVTLAFLVLDLVVALAEYRVWDVGMVMTGDPWKAAGYVAISAMPFYLGQAMWLYPLAGRIQQAIASLMVILAIVTSAIFGTADLSNTYDVAQISRMVSWLTGSYVLLIIGYILSDRRIQANRLVAKTKAEAAFVGEEMRASDRVLGHLEESMSLQAELIDKYGPEAVEAQLERMRRRKKGKVGANNDRLLPPGPKPQSQARPNFKSYNLASFCEAMGMTVEEFVGACNGRDANAVYQLLRPGVEAIDISRKNFAALVDQAHSRAGHPNA